MTSGTCQSPRNAAALGWLIALFGFPLAAYTLLIAYGVITAASQGWWNLHLADVWDYPRETTALAILVGFPWLALAVPVFALIVARRAVP